MKINLQLHIHTRDDYKMRVCMGEKGVYEG
jgi:hypothetical protein